MSRDQDVWYERHPVSPERKSELRGRGYKIIDAVFKPFTPLRDDGPTVAEYVAAGYRAATYPPEGFASRSSAEEVADAIAAQGADANADGKLSVAEVRDALTAAGVQFDPKAKKADLQALLDAATKPPEV